MSKIKFLVAVGLSVVLMLGLLLGACSSETPVGGTNVIKIGAPGPLSGGAATWGLPEDRGLRMLVDMVNAEGGITIGGETYVFTVVSVDSKFTIEGANAAAQKLVSQDHVQYAIGGIDKHEVMAMQAVFEPAGVIHASVGWGSGVVRADAPHSFRCPGTPTEFTPLFVEIVLERYPDAKKWALISYDTPGMRECFGQMEPYFAPMGLEVVAVEYFDFAALEFYPLLSELIDLGVDAIIPVSEGPQRGLLVKQARELGYTGLFADLAPVSASDIIDIAGEEAAEGYLTCGAATFGPMATPESSAFYEAYVTSYGQWEANVIDVSIAFQVFVEAMKIADSVDVEDVLAVLHTGGPFNSILGPIYIGGLEAYGTNNQFFVPLAVQQIQNGELVNLELMTAEAQLESFGAVASQQ